MRCSAASRRAVPLHRPQQLQHASDVVVVVDGRREHRFADDDLARELHDGIEAVRLERAIQRTRIAQVARHQRPPSHVLPPPAVEVVKDDGVVAVLSELLAPVRADVAGTAADQYFALHGAPAPVR